MTIDEVAAEMGLTRDQVHWAEQSALAKLKRWKGTPQLLGFREAVGEMNRVHVTGYRGQGKSNGDEIYSGADEC